jgi:undecaprenyl-diphosphatase
VLRALDLALLRLMRTRGHPPALERTVQALTRTGEHSVIWYALAGMGMALDSERRAVYRRAALIVLGVDVANAVVKLAIGRPRPVLEGLPALTRTMSERSYPSAHASTSFAGARVLSEAISPPAVYSLAAAMALSRPYLGVHYPSDVVAGALFGDALARLSA